MFTAYDDVVVRTWDVLRGEPVGDLKGHTERISCVDVSSDGYALASGSWDHQIRVCRHCAGRILFFPRLTFLFLSL